MLKADLFVTEISEVDNFHGPPTEDIGHFTSMYIDMDVFELEDGQ